MNKQQQRPPQKQQQKKDEKLYNVKVGKTIVPMNMHQLIANAGRGVMAARIGEYNAKYKEPAKKFNELGLTDEEYQSLLDAKKNRNIEAAKYFTSLLVPEVDEDEDANMYRPIIENKEGEEFDFLNQAKEFSGDSYLKFKEATETIGYDVYNSIRNIQDPFDREMKAKALYDDIVSGKFDSTIGKAMYVSATNDKDILSAYLEVAEKEETINFGNNPTPNSQNNNNHENMNTNTNDVQNDGYNDSIYNLGFAGVDNDENDEIIEDGEYEDRLQQMRQKFG